MRAHATQIAADDPFFSLFEDKSDGMSFGREHYLLVEGPRGPGPDRTTGKRTCSRAGLARTVRSEWAERVKPSP